jgi:hypothetical protein
MPFAQLNFYQRIVNSSVTAGIIWTAAVIGCQRARGFDGYPVVDPISTAVALAKPSKASVEGGDVELTLRLTLESNVAQLALGLHSAETNALALAVQSSLDFSNWTDWKILTNQTLPLALRDLPASGEGRQYFRAKILRCSLTNWKLTLPVSTSPGGTPDEIAQPELAAYRNSDYFYFSPPMNAWVFRAPCGGVATDNSGYPRSELREMTDQGTAMASWSTTSGVHTLEITEAITSIPLVKRHVVAGQIHSASDDVIVVRLEGRKLFFDENGNQGPILTKQYNLGDIFTVKFQAYAGGVDCYYNGLKIYRYATRAAGCYFKAGCYTQSNTQKGDEPSAFGEVLIYGMSVSHTSS